ncbi:hypothetical protein BH09BAC5_BH09BAC5_05350 [soil metagenome]
MINNLQLSFFSACLRAFIEFIEAREMFLICVLPLSREGRKVSPGKSGIIIFTDDNFFIN